jgi:hypothetical protein
VVRSDAPGGDPWRRQSKAIALHGRFVHAQANPQQRRRRGKSPCAVAQRVSYSTLRMSVWHRLPAHRAAPVLGELFDLRPDCLGE